MTVEFHPAVQSDVREALKHFDREGGSALGDRFYTELQRTIGSIIENPTRYGFFSNDTRRAGLHIFRYHLLYKIRGDQIRVLVLRHDRRRPQFGSPRV